MDAERRILKSTAILFAASIASQLANFLFVLMLARVFGPQIFGEYVFALSLGILLAVFVSCGTNQLLLRRSSSDPTEWRANAGALFPTQVILVGTTWVGVLTASHVVGVDGVELRILAIVVLFQLLVPLTVLFSIGFTATERMAYFALSDFGIRTAILAIGGAAIWAGFSLDRVLLIMPISGLVAIAALAYCAFREFGKPDFALKFSEVSALFRQALPFFWIVALNLIYMKAGLLFLRAISSAEQVGLFASAERLVMAIGILYITFGNAILPAFVKLAAGERGRFLQLTGRCARLMLLISMPVATFFFIFSDELIQFLFGDEYRNAAGALRVVAWVIGLRGVSVVLESIGIASDNKTSVVIGKSVGVVFLSISCAFLVPAYGAIGLAYSVVVAQATALITVYLHLQPTGFVPPLARQLLPIVIVCAVTVLVSGFLSEWGLVARVAFVAAFGTILLFVCGAVRLADLDFLRQLSVKKS